MQTGQPSRSWAPLLLQSGIVFHLRARRFVTTPQACTLTGSTILDLVLVGATYSPAPLPTILTVHRYHTGYVGGMGQA